MHAVYGQAKRAHQSCEQHSLSLPMPSPTQSLCRKGTRYPIYDAAYLCRDYPEEHARPGDWKKCKGIATLVDKNGKTMEAEIHWYEAISSEKYDVKYKHK